MKQAFKESFIPVLFGVAVLSITLVGVRLAAVSEAERAIVIDIPAMPEAKEAATTGADDEADSGERMADGGDSAAGDDPRVVEAETLAKEGRNGEAIARYLEVIASNPNPRLLADLGMAYYRQGDKKKAIQALDQAIAAEPRMTKAHYNRAVVFSSLHRYEKAIVDYHSVIEVNPNHYEALFNLGLAQRKLDDGAAAALAFGRASEVAGGMRKAKALYQLGLTYKGMGAEREQEAIRSLQQAIRIQPDYLRARYQLARLWMQQPARRQDAQEELEKILSLDAAFTPASYQLALLLEDQGKAEAARRVLNNARTRDPGDIDIALGLGRLSLAEASWKEAAEQFERVVQRQPDNANAHFYLGRCAYGMRQYERAVNSYKRAIELRKGDYPEAHLNLGIAYGARKDYSAAIESYRRALAGKPDYAAAWYNTGTAWMKQEKYAEAANAFQRAVELDRAYSEAWFNLGIAYTELARDDDAIAAYQSAVTARPRYKEAKLNLAVRYAHKGDYRRAIIFYREVLELDDSYSSGWINLGIAYAASSQAELADEAFRKAMALDPSNPKPKRLLAESLLKQRRADESATVYAGLVESEPGDVRLHVGFAQALIAAGRRDQAVAELEKAQRLNPSDATIAAEVARIKKPN